MNDTSFHWLRKEERENMAEALRIAIQHAELETKYRAALFDNSERLRTWRMYLAELQKHGE